jgi:hypothetical protein
MLKSLAMVGVAITLGERVAHLYSKYAATAAAEAANR